MDIDPVFARNPREAELFAAKHVVIVGLGSVGGALALMAARAGIGRFTLIDNDALRHENVGRHMLARDSIGMAKAKAVKRAIKGINPVARVSAFVEDFRELSPGEIFNGSEPDVLIAATDSFACDSQMNTISLEHKLPAVYAGCWGEASVGEVLYVIPGQTPCFECFAAFRRETASLPLDDPKRYTDPAFDGTKVPGQAGLWPNILMAAAAAFQVILGILDPNGNQGKNLIDGERTLLLLNVSDYDSPLQPLAVTFGRVTRGCTICDESKLGDLRKSVQEHGG